MLRYIYTFVYMYDMNVKNTENMANKFIFPSMYVEKEMWLCTKLNVPNVFLAEPVKMLPRSSNNESIIAWSVTPISFCQRESFWKSG
jgi:hypothetical protein